MTVRAAPRLGEKGYARVAFDNYKTPPDVTDVLVDVAKPAGQVWEPAAGDGDMVRQLRTRGLSVFASDIRDLPDLDWPVLDFESSLEWVYAVDDGRIPWPDWIITNPPYAFAERFIERSLSLTEQRRGSVAMLLGNEFDAPAGHRWMFKHQAFDAKVMLPRRIRWLGFEDKASPRQVHAWFVWRWARKPGPPAILYP